MERNARSTTAQVRPWVLALTALCLSCGDGSGSRTASTTQRAQPLSLGSSRAFIGLDLGDHFGCLIQHDGDVACWGLNNEKQLGRMENATTNADSLADPQVVSTAQFSSLPMHAVAVAAGHAHACAVRDSGEVVCWGLNSSGQCGQATPGAIVPQRASGFDPGQNAAQAVTAGISHTCALLYNGQVVCWGSNAEGQLGNPGAGPWTHLPTTVQSDVDWPLENVVQVEAAGNQTCARTGDGRIFCWGTGVLSGSARATQLTNASEITDLAVGDEHVCIRGGEGSVWCRGGNAFGQLGRGSPSGSLGDFAPVLVSGGGALSNVASIFGGRYSTCAILADGTARCWGASFQGRLGTGDPSPNNAVAHPMLGVEHATAGSTGNTHTCVVAADFAGLRCTGSDWYGELGNGTASTSDQPAPVPVLMTETVPVGIDPFRVYVAQTRETQGRALIAGGGSHFCTIVRNVETVPGTVESRVFCWGRNSSGQCGPRRSHWTEEGVQEFFDEDWTPRRVTLAGIPAAVSAGATFSCALLTDGRVQCWGYNGTGELGFEDEENLVAPRFVDGISNAVAISSGDAHTCALLADGFVKCWGNNVYGQIGAGILQHHSNPDHWGATPRTVANLSRVIQVVAGSNHTCAMRSNGSVTCWGHADFHAVGPGYNEMYYPYSIYSTQYTVRSAPNLLIQDGMSGDSLPIIRTPQSPYTANRVPVGLNAGRDFSCVRYAHGAIECWGSRNDGRCGDDPLSGGMNPSVRPLVVGTLGNAIAASSRGVSSCAITRDGRAYCWGSCTILGNGASCPSPVLPGLNRGGVRASLDDVTPGEEIRGFVAVALTSIGAACGVRGDGSVRCWGSNAHGMLGAGIDPGAPGGMYRTFPINVTFPGTTPL